MKKLALLILVISTCSIQLYTQQSRAIYSRLPNISDGVFVTQDDPNLIIINDVPAYLWHRGCGPTALGMVVGYYDTHGCGNLIDGDASTQTNNVNDAIASNEHYDDYSLPKDSPPKLLKDKSATNNAHSSNCIADFMKTSWSSRKNYWGWSWYCDINNAFEEYVHLRDSKYVLNTKCEFFNNDVDISWNIYKYEIDNNRPVVLLVDINGDKATDHFVTAIGYNEIDTLYAIYNTWDHNVHWYKFRKISNKWGWGIYSMNIFSIGFNVSVDVNPSNAGIIEGAGDYDYRDSANLTATAQAGCDFVCWTENGTTISTNPNYRFNITENRILVANFEMQKFNVLADENPSNSGTVSGANVYNYGDAVYLSATPQTGYEFINWTEDGNEVSLNPDYNFIVTENKNLTANFKIQTFNVLADANPSNGGTVSGANDYDYGDTVYLSATEQTGYGFVNWTVDEIEVSANPDYNFIVTENKNLTANFDIKTTIYDNIDKKNIKIYPNPAINQVHIITTDIYNLTISDITGKRILNEIQFAEGSIDISNFHKGTYLITFANKNGSVTKKLIVR